MMKLNNRLVCHQLDFCYGIPKDQIIQRPPALQMKDEQGYTTWQVKFCTAHLYMK